MSAKVAQIIQNFFVKVAQVTSQARLVPGGNTSAGRPNKWFNLRNEEVEAIKDELRAWRMLALESGEFSPLILESYVDPSSMGPGQAMVLRDDTNNTATQVPRKEVVLERWIVEIKAPSSSQSIDPPVLYKRAIVAIRALYTMCRLLPAWGLRQRLVRRKLSQSPLKIGFRVLRGGAPISSGGRIGLSKPVPANTQNHLGSYHFTPMETPCGTIQMAVSYRYNVSFDIEDAETVMAQQFLDLDSRSTPSRPTLAYTRPFKDSTSSLATQGSPRRTPSTSSIARASAVAIPINRSQQSPDPAVTGSVSSSISRFSSSFANRVPVPRSASLESHSRTRPVSITSGSVSSGGGSSLEPGSGLYMPQQDIGDFVRFVDDASKRFSASNTAQGQGAVLAKYQGMRQSFSQLSDSLTQSTTLRAGSHPPESSISSGLGAAGVGSSRRLSGTRQRLGFYFDPHASTEEAVEEEPSEEEPDGDELLFAMSDMHCS